MKLTNMKPGDRAVVTDVAGSGQLRKRMLDLGITKGAVIELVRIAPLGDPVEIGLRGYRLTLRKGDAALVELAPAVGGRKEVPE